MSKNLLLITLIIAAIFFIPSKTDDQGDWVDVFHLIPLFIHPFYAGYLNITNTKALYYAYFPSQSNPSRDPLVVHISPVPGCSSMHGTFYTQGPFIFEKNSTQFKYNTYNWNKKANLLYIQGPAGVGFSTSDQVTILNDMQTVFDYYKSILKFYEKFPELKDQGVYLTGYQYAGVILPYLALRIVQHNAQPSTPSSQKIRLKGLLLNNPCTLQNECYSNFQYSQYTIAFLKNHYFLSEQLYQNYRAACIWIFPTPECQKMRKDIEAKFQSTGSDIHNIFTQCLNQGHGNLYPCLDLIGLTSFFTSQQIKKTMHANAQHQWQYCNSTILQKYQRDPRGSYSTYEKLLKQQNDLKIWVVSGVFNGVVPTMGTKRWIQQLKIDLGLQTLRLHQPWMYNNSINGGNVEQLKGITYISVRSAGYNVYLDQPQLGFYIYSQFINQTGRL